MVFLRASRSESRSARRFGPPARPGAANTVTGTLALRKAGRSR
jgi:hypothetical protein